MRNFPPSRIFINWNIFECPKTSMLYVMAWLTFWNECLYLVEVSFVLFKNTEYEYSGVMRSYRSSNVEYENWKPCNFLKRTRIELKNGWQVADNRVYKKYQLASVKMLLEWLRRKARFHTEKRQILNFKGVSPRKFLKIDKWRPHIS